MSDKFNALMLEQIEGKVTPVFKELTIDQLPAGDVLIKIEYSTLNYKDGMVINGLGRMVRQYPHIPGIDFAGVVVDSQSPCYKAGDKVILTGWRVGETHWGGYSQMARVKAEWLVPLPQTMNTKRAMAIGTAGFTAMLAVMALEDHGLNPSKEGEVLVTGAAGGVGSTAVAILAYLGYKVAASTGRPSAHDYLRKLGASSIVDRNELAVVPKAPLLGERWAGVVDTVGGSTLSNVLASLKHRCSVSACGLAGGNDLNTTVIPFLLRGNNLLGIDSGASPFAERMRAWQRLVTELPIDLLDDMTQVIGLKDLPEWAKLILKGDVKGRTVVDVNK